MCNEEQSLTTAKVGPIQPITFTFKDFGYDPETSNISYGDTKIISNTAADLPASARLYDLTQEDEPGSYSDEQTFTLQQDRSVSFGQTIELDVTTSNETKIGGTVAGVGAEDTISTSFGYKNTEEYSQSRAESTSKAETFTFNVDLPPRKATLITAEAQNVNSATPMTGEMTATFAVDVWLSDNPCVNANSYNGNQAEWYGTGIAAWVQDDNNTKWCHGKTYPQTGEWHPWASRIGYIAAGGCTIEFESVDAIKTWIEGKNVDWPGLDVAGYGWRYNFCKNECWEAQRDALERIDVRYLHLDATQRRQYQDSIQQKVADVTDVDADGDGDHDRDDLDAIAREHGIEVQGRPSSEEVGFVGESEPADARASFALPFWVTSDAIFVWDEAAGVIEKYDVTGERIDDFEIVVGASR